MDKDFFTQTTTDLYRLTLLFPKKEPLRYKMREVADEVLANSLRLTVKQELLRNNPEGESISNSEIIKNLLENLEIFTGFFEVVKAQNWVKADEVLAMQGKYDKLKEEILIFSQQEEATLANKKLPLNFDQPAITERAEAGVFTSIQEKINSRQQRILEILKDKEKTQVWEVKKVFPDVTKRTLRRDFEYLLKQELIERMGEKNNTFYQIRSKVKEI